MIIDKLLEFIGVCILITFGFWAILFLLTGLIYIAFNVFVLEFLWSWLARCLLGEIVLGLLLLLFRMLYLVVTGK